MFARLLLGSLEILPAERLLARPLRKKYVLISVMNPDPHQMIRPDLLNESVFYQYVLVCNTGATDPDPDPTF